MSDDKKPGAFPFAHQETPPPRRSPIPDHPPALEDEPVTNPAAPAVHGWVRGVVAEAGAALNKRYAWALAGIIVLSVLFGVSAAQAFAADVERKIDKAVTEKNRNNADRFDLMDRRFTGLEKGVDGINDRLDQVLEERVKARK